MRNFVQKVKISRRWGCNCKSLLAIQLASEGVGTLIVIDGRDSSALRGVLNCESENPSQGTVTILYRFISGKIPNTSVKQRPVKPIIRLCQSCHQISQQNIKRTVTYETTRPSTASIAGSEGPSPKWQNNGFKNVQKNRPMKLPDLQLLAPVLHIGFLHHLHPGKKRNIPRKHQRDMQ